MKRAVAVTVSTLVLGACADQPGPNAPTGPGAPLLAIVDGHNDPDRNHFFFLAPIRPLSVQPPRTSPFNPRLSPVVEVCEWNGTACVRLISRLTMSTGHLLDRVYVAPTLQEYGVLWRTAPLNLSQDKTYRIHVLVGTEVLGFADIDVVRTIRQLVNVDRDEFVPLLKDFILPIRFRIEEGALCEPGTSCSSASVDLGDNVPDVVQLPTGDGVTVPPQNDGGQNVAVTITVQECEDDIDVDLPTFGRCLTITADPPLVGALDPPAIIQVCDVDFDVHTAGLAPEQERLVTLHRQSGETIQALPHAEDDCPEPVPSPIGSLQAKGFRGYAQAAWNLMGRGVAAAFEPRPLHASLAVFDVGGGGESDFFSDFQFALPAQMTAVEGTDGQRGVAGTLVLNPPAVLVTDRTGRPVAGATVTFEITGGGGLLGSTSALSLADGIARVPSWRLGDAPGTNTARASGRGIAGPEDGGPFMPDLPTDPEPSPDRMVPITVGLGTVDFTVTGLSAAPNAGELVQSFGDFIRMHNVSIASDGSNYYTINGGNAAFGQINRYGLAGNFISTVDVALDMRAILYNPADARFYVKTFERDWYRVDPITGSFTLVHSGIFSSVQSAPALTPDGASIIEHSAGTVRILNASTGALTATLTGFAFGGVTSPAFGVDDAIATDGTHLFTWDGMTVFVYDMSGTSLSSIPLPLEIPGFALAYTNGLLWLSLDGAGGPAGAEGFWYGFLLGSGAGGGAPIAAAAPRVAEVTQSGTTADDTIR